MRKQPEVGKKTTIRKFARFRRKAEKTAVAVADNTVGHIEENLLNKAHKFRDIRLLVLEWSLMVFAIIILALLQSFWFTDSYSSSVFGTGGNFVEGTIGQVNSLNPLFASTDSEKTLSKLLFATLTAPDYSGHSGPALAASVKAEDGGKVWRVKLRDNLKWSDGEPLTAADVLFTVSLIQNPKVSTPYSSHVSNVQLRLDGDALVFTLPSAYADFATALTLPILPEHILKDADPALLLEHSFSSAPVSSGPFRYNATQVTNGEAVVYLNPNQYYYNGRPLLDSFAVHTFDTQDAVIAALNSGAITASASLGPESAPQITNPNIYQKQTSIKSGVFLFMNTASSVFKNRTARTALQQGIDLAALRSEILGDEPALNYPILGSQIKLDTWPELPAYDPAAARSTLSAYAGQPITLATINSGYFPAIAERISQALRDLGLAVELATYDSIQDFMAAVVTSRDYDLLLYEIELGADPDLFAYYHSSQTGTNGSNLSNYNDAVADKLIISARSSLDTSVRRSQYEAFLSRWVENAPAIGIYQVNLSYYLNRNVRVFGEDTTLVFPTDRFGDVETWSASHTTKFLTP